MQKLAFQTALTFEVENAKAAAQLPEKGVTLHDWSPEQRGQFRTGALEAWETWADRTPEAREIVDSHYAFMDLLGLRDAQ
jgi:hypothetical protein